MKKFFGTLCIAIFVGSSSAAILFGFFYLLQRMIQTELLALQVIAVALLLCLALAYVAGAVRLILAVKKKKP